MSPALSTNVLAYHVWRMRTYSPGPPSTKKHIPPDASYHRALADWVTAQHVRDQLIAEAAYLHWINRGRPFGDPLTDWFAVKADTIHAG